MQIWTPNSPAPSIVAGEEGTETSYVLEAMEENQRRLYCTREAILYVFCIFDLTWEWIWFLFRIVLSDIVNLFWFSCLVFQTSPFCFIVFLLIMLKIFGTYEILFD